MCFTRERRGQAQFDASRRGKKELKFDLIQGTNRSGEGEQACYVTPDLNCDYCTRKREREKKGEDNQWDGGNKNEKTTPVVCGTYTAVRTAL